MYHRLTAKCIFTNRAHLVTISQIKKQNISVPPEVPSCSLLVTGVLGGVGPTPKDNISPGCPQQRLVFLGFILYINRIVQCVLFCVWFLSFIIVFVRFVHMVVCCYGS